MQLGPIPWTDVSLYAEVHGLEPDLVQPFIYIVRTMDIAYLDWLDKEEERKRGSKDKK